MSIFVNFCPVSRKNECKVLVVVPNLIEKFDKSDRRLKTPLPENPKSIKASSNPAGYTASFPVDGSELGLKVVVI